MPILDILTDIRDALENLEGLLTALTSVGTDQLDVNVKAIDVPVNADTVDTFHAAAAPAANKLLAMDGATKFPAHTIGGAATIDGQLTMTTGKIRLMGFAATLEAEASNRLLYLLVGPYADRATICGIWLNYGGNIYYRVSHESYDHVFLNRDAELARLTGDGRLGILDATPAEALDVNGTVRADAYIEFSPMFTGNALDLLAAIQPLPGTGLWPDVDHQTLPDRVAHVVHEERWFNIQSGHEMPRGFSPPIEPPVHNFELRKYDRTCRSLPANVQMNQRAIVQLLERVQALESQP